MKSYFPDVPHICHHLHNLWTIVLGAPTGSAHAIYHCSFVFFRGFGGFFVFLLLPAITCTFSIVNKYIIILDTCQQCDDNNDSF